MFCQIADFIWQRKILCWLLFSEENLCIDETQFGSLAASTTSHKNWSCRSQSPSDVTYYIRIYFSSPTNTAFESVEKRQEKVLVIQPTRQHTSCISMVFFYQQAIGKNTNYSNITYEKLLYSYAIFVLFFIFLIIACQK